jgi:hypothetical protein
MGTNFSSLKTANFVSILINSKKFQKNIQFDLQAHFHRIERFKLTV